MKRFLFAIAAITVAATSLTSCFDKNGEAQAEEESFRIDSVCCDTTFAYGKGKDAPTCEVSIHFPFAVGTNAAEFNDSVVNYLIDAKRESVLDSAYFSRMVAKGADGFIQLFREDIDDASDSNPEYMRGAGYYLSVKHSVWDAPDSILVCEIDESTFTGGAHGSYSESYINVDKATGHVVSLSDICDPAHEKELIDAIVKQIMADNGCTTLEQLQEDHAIFLLCDEPMVASQFYYGPDGITFVYNEYEIAPYAAGVIKATLPYAVMSKFAPSAKTAK